MAEIVSNLKFNQVLTEEASLAPVTSGTTNVNVVSANTTITPKDHGGVTLLVLDSSSVITLNVNAPVNAGTVHRFVYGGQGTSAANIVIDGNASMIGCIHDLIDEDASRLPGGIRPNIGAANNTLTIPTGTEAFQITMVSNSDNQWIIWGTYVGLTIPSFSTA